MDLYYYTNIGAMCCILQKSNIYATNLKYMNDSEEYANGLKELRTIFKEKGDVSITQERLQEELEQDVATYSISFSTKRDLLSQWSMYAGESGISFKMVFSGNERYKAYLDNGERDYLTEEGVILKPQEIFYCTKDAMEQTSYEAIRDSIWEKIFQGEDEIVKKDFNGNYERLWKKMAPYVKRVEFEAENEYRLAFERNQWKESNYRIDYRNSKNVLKPYLDVECEGGWPIHEIMIGPGFNQDVVYNSVLHYLNNSIEIHIKDLAGEKFWERCNEYFYLYGSIPDSLKRLWEKKREDFKDKTMEDAYRLFVGIKSEMIRELKEEKNTECLERLKKGTITKRGIILTKSRIPYIFQN